MALEIETVPLSIPEEKNIIFGQAHFIKTVEDLYEAIVTSVPGARFGLAFSEASGPCLIRSDGTDDSLRHLAEENLKKVAAGHTFLVVLDGVFPINVLPRIQSCPEVVRVFCATANPVQVLVARSEQGGGVLGVVDGSAPKGVEGAQDREARHAFLRTIGYKR